MTRQTKPRCAPLPVGYAVSVSKERNLMSNSDLIILKIFNIWDPIEDENFWEALIEVGTGRNGFGIIWC